MIGEYGNLQLCFFQKWHIKDLTSPEPAYNLLDPNSLKILTRFRLWLYNFNFHDFKECENPGSVSHFFLHCYFFIDIRKTLFNELQSVDENILNQSENDMVELLLYGRNKSKFQHNCSLLKSSIKLILG